MTISTMGQRHTGKTRDAQSLTTPQKNLTRMIEIAALNPDETLQVAEFETPAIPLFDNAFSAFTGDTYLNTTNGQASIEDLTPGDMLLSSVGKPCKIIWISTSTFVPAHQERNAPLVRIMADTFGKNSPASFLTIGPCARLLSPPSQKETVFPDHKNDPMLMQGHGFIDNVNVIKISPPTPIRLFHICTEQHSIINVEGVEMETYHPGLSFPLDTSPEIRRKFLSMFPRITRLSDFGPLAYPRLPDKV